MTSKVVYKTWNIVYAKRKTYGEKNSENNFIWYFIIFDLGDTFL